MKVIPGTFLYIKFGIVIFLFLCKICVLSWTAIQNGNRHSPASAVKWFILLLSTNH